VRFCDLHLRGALVCALVCAPVCALLTRCPFAQEYEFKVKPGSLARRPAVISPYHYRLDWLMSAPAAPAPRARARAPAERPAAWRREAFITTFNAPKTNTETDIRAQRPDAGRRGPRRWFLPFGDPRRNPWFYHLIGLSRTPPVLTGHVSSLLPY